MTWVACNGNAAAVASNRANTLLKVLDGFLRGTHGGEGNVSLPASCHTTKADVEVCGAKECKRAVPLHLEKMIGVSRAPGRLEESHEFVLRRGYSSRNWLPFLLSRFCVHDPIRSSRSRRREKTLEGGAMIVSKLVASESEKLSVSSFTSETAVQLRV